MYLACRSELLHGFSGDFLEMIPLTWLTYD
jgi:hypothetical protein